MRLGVSSAIQSDVAVMGAIHGGGADYWSAPGIVAVFRKDPQGGWAYSETIEPFDGEPQDNFGWKVALDGQWLAVICSDDRLPGQHGDGSVYMYEDVGGGFVFHSRLVPPPGGNQTLNNAQSVDIDGDRLVIGAGAYHLIDAQYTGPNSGAIHVYDFDGSDWQHSDSATDGRLGMPGGVGQFVQIEGDTIVAGNSSYVVSGFAQGLAVVFDRSPSGLWEIVDRLESPYPLQNSRFGLGLSLDGDRLAISATRGAGGYGSVEIFERRPNGKWRREMSAYPEQFSLASLGRYVDLRGNRLLMGSDGLDPADASVYPGGVMHFTDCDDFWGLDGRVQLSRTFHGGYFEQGFAFDDHQMLLTYPGMNVGGVASVGGGHIIQVPGPYPSTCEELGVPIGLPSIAAPCPCSNDPIDPLRGCANSTGHGARVWARGQLSLSNAACRLQMEGLPPWTLGLVTHVGGLTDFSVPPAASGDGLLLRHSFYNPVSVHVFEADAMGEASWTPPPLLPIGIEAGRLGSFQVLYRDPAGPCGSRMNWAAGFVGQFVP